MISAPAKSGAGLPRPRGAEYNERVPPRKLWLIPWGQAGRGTCAPCPAPSDLQVRPPLGVPPKFHPAASLGPLLLPQPICNSTLQWHTGVDQRWSVRDRSPCPWIQVLWRVVASRKNTFALNYCDRVTQLHSYPPSLLCPPTSNCLPRLRALWPPAPTEHHTGEPSKK